MQGGVPWPVQKKWSHTMNKKNQSIDQYYTDISSTIDKSKHSVQRAVNDAMVMLYWTIGKYLVCNVLDNNKAEYGQKVVEELALKLTLNYGKGFEKTSLFRMIKFYREFPDNQIVATLSQQLTWSHFCFAIRKQNVTKRNIGTKIVTGN